MSPHKGFISKNAHARSMRNLGRPRPHRTPRCTILIICEGKKTEPQYFRSLRCELRLSSIEVEVCGGECGTDPVSLVTYARDRRQEQERLFRRGEAARYDEVWCVLDTESYRQVGPRKLFDAMKMACDNAINMAVSNPCFEYWLILHFEKTGQALHNSKGAVARLKKHLRDYSKGTDVFNRVYPHTNEAIQWAGDILRSQWQDVANPALRDPSTQVHLLVQQLLKVASEASAGAS